jgi:transcriptional regulator with XRE-family HTH domain/tetratricopeptide (TPR) repeat protein
MVEKEKRPNKRLRRERELKGWSQRTLAERLGTTEQVVSRWESGLHRPNRNAQTQLCQLFGKSAEELGFMGKNPVEETEENPAITKGEDTFEQFTSPLQIHPQETPSLPTQIVSPNILSWRPSIMAFPVAARHPAWYDAYEGGQNGPSLFLEQALVYPDEQQSAEWLLQGAGYLGLACQQGWMFTDLVDVLRVVFPVAKAIQMITRRNFLQTGATVAMNGIPILSEKHITEEERQRLHETLSESIAQAWKLFISAGNAQALMLGQMQLALIQQAHAFLYPSARPFLYAGVYGLIGIALHFQERDEEALQAHNSAYMAALATAEPWYIAQSLICQSDCYHSLGKYSLAIQTIQEALRIIGRPADSSLVRARAHLLTCWADNAMMLEDYTVAREKLNASEAYLDQIAPDTEFDRAGWLLLAGKYELLTKHYSIAMHYFREALAEIPEQWGLRRAMTGIGLMKAYARMKERNESLSIAEEFVPTIQTINAHMTNRWLTEYLQQDLLAVFPTDDPVQKFVARTYQRLPQLTLIS